MALFSCADCKGQVSSDATACPHCGAKTPRAKMRRSLLLVLVCACLVLAGGVLWIRHAAEEAAAEKARKALEDPLGPFRKYDR